MQLYILGNNSDDKGNQLEKLTFEILKKSGFSNIIKNEIGSGGHEIDVRAEYTVSGLNGDIKKPLICECKAYQNPVAMSDWLKFLGKVLLEENKGDVDGFFIALSGVNGNVYGNYRDLKSYRNNVTLITGEDLIKQLNEMFQLASIDTLQKSIEKFTQRKPIEISLCYYNMCVYFLIGFANNEYSIISNSGDLEKTQEANLIKSLVVKNTSFQYFIDLENENTSIIRQTKIEKYIISFMLLEENELSQSSISDLFNKHPKDISEVNSDEMTKALSNLITKRLLYKRDDNKLYQLTLLSKNKNINDVVNFYLYLFGSVTPIFAIGCENYKKSINDELLSEVCRIQGGVNIPEEYKQKCLKILQWSPSALSWSLIPDKLITNHRSNGKAIQKGIEDEDTSYFLQKLITLLSEDFKNNSLKEYFFNTCNFAELETNFQIILKSNKKEELNMNYKERIGLGQLAEEYNSQVIQIRVFNDELQPWE